jgi:hydroxyacylglutathione hydrolase
MSEVRVSAIPAFHDNYFWLLEVAGHAAVVDPGAAEAVEAVLAQRGLKLDAILLTHHHLDHVGGVASLCARRPGLRVIAPFDDRIAGTERVAEGDRISVLEQAFEVLEVPGHTASHIAYRDHEKAFVGDTLFSLGCGRLFEGTPAQMFASLEKLADSADEMKIYCAHEYTQANLRFAQYLFPDDPRLHTFAAQLSALRAQGLASVPSDLGFERQHNPFLRMADPESREYLRRRGLGVDPRDPAQAFAVVRRLKDSF